MPVTLALRNHTPPDDNSPYVPRVLVTSGEYWLCAVLGWFPQSTATTLQLTQTGGGSVPASHALPAELELVQGAGNHCDNNLGIDPRRYHGLGLGFNLGATNPVGSTVRLQLMDGVTSVFDVSYSL